MANTIEANDHAAKGKLGSLNPDEVRRLVRDGLVSMEMTERENFIQALDIEMRRSHFDIRAFLIPLGIPGRSPEDLTPTEVGHLIRFLLMIRPNVMPAVGRVIARYDVFACVTSDSGGGRLAA